MSVCAAVYACTHGRRHDANVPAHHAVATRTHGLPLGSVIQRCCGQLSQSLKLAMFGTDLTHRLCFRQSAACSMGPSRIARTVTSAAARV